MFLVAPTVPEDFYYSEVEAYTIAAHLVCQEFFLKSCLGFRRKRLHSRSSKADLLPQDTALKFHNISDGDSLMSSLSSLTGLQLTPCTLIFSAWRLVRSISVVHLAPGDLPVR